MEGEAAHGLSSRATHHPAARSRSDRKDLRTDLVWLVLNGEEALEGDEACQGLLREKAMVMVPVGSFPPDDPRPGWSYPKALLVVIGLDKPGVRGDISLFDDLLEGRWTEVSVSNVTGEGFDVLGWRTFEALGIIVYSKQPGKPADVDKPFTLPRGSKVSDMAGAIHKEISESFKFGRIWGAQVFDGQKVTGDHVLEEGDVVEIHI